jgi:S1-C subfamily serine protease
MSNGSFKSARILFWLVLLAAGFAAGVAWNSKNNQKVATQEERPRAIATSDKSFSDSATEERQGPLESEAILNPEEKATIALFQNAAPSVCYITTTNLRTDIFRQNVSEVPRGSGSGFVWNNNGHIITNYHVIQGADRATVTLSDGSTYQAKAVGVAPEKDLAVLKIDAPRNILSPIPLGSSHDLKVGQSVYAIGNPFGLDQTLTTGIVSALGREIKSVAGIPIRDAIQTDAAINPGNSGGPLLNSSGKLIGVNTAIFSPSGASAGIGFSIPVDAVKWVVPELIKYGKIKRPSLGIDIRSDIARRLQVTDGILVIMVSPQGAAEKAGLRPTYNNQSRQFERIGDIIVAINGEKVSDYNDLFLALEKYNPGDQVRLTVIRDKQQLEIPVVLDASS